jgi:ABC-type nickel/cobalt efflux system permease component RcnA
LIHLIITSLYSRSIPTSLFWWALQFGSAALMAALGIWLCQWRELKPTFGFSKTTPEAAILTNQAQPDLEAEAGFNRGRGRGRGDDAGNYELVGMEPHGERS